MDGTRLADRISKGYGVAARKLGTPYTVFRPSGIDEPLHSSNRVMRLAAAFNAEEPHFGRVAAFGHPVWWGVFDGAYTQPGDYLVGAAGTFFVAGQRPLLPVQCVRAEHVVQVTRAAAPLPGGYGGSAVMRAVLTGWPASILAASAHGGDAASDGARLGTWTILLPRLPVALAAADAVTDEAGRQFVVATAEESDLGWRLLARQIAA